MSNEREKTKAPYERPQLVVYGSVRNLTGGSTSSESDAGMSSDGRAGTGK